MTLDKNNYKKLQELSKKTASLESIQHLLEWDQETYMPKGALAYRGEQIELLASLIHKQKTSSSFTKALSKLIDLETGELVDASLLPSQIAALREWRRLYLINKKLPNSFVKKFAKTASTTIAAWAEAKQRGNFKAFAPHLEKVVALCRKKAEYLGTKESLYDPLLDLFEPGMTVKRIAPLFDKLKQSLIFLLKKISFCQDIPHEFLEGSFAKDKQLDFGNKILKKMGFDETTCRLDLSNHPFCMPISPKDLRLTTRIHPTHLLSNIFAVIHEGGHGLYHMNLPEGFYGTPLYDSVSLGIDESQSLFWEKRIGRSAAFWRYFFPLLQKEFPEKLQNIYFDDFYRAMNRVTPSMIRIEADEITYCLHVILRFEIEKAVLDGSLNVKEIPEAWNEKMRDYLGIYPKSDSEGCLQDIHWAMGAIGYFPTYALGNLYSAQLFSAFNTAHPGWKQEAEHGHLESISTWLEDHIHQYGKEYQAEDLIKRVTGEPLSEVFFTSYLEEKYRSIYHYS